MSKLQSIIAMNPLDYINNNSMTFQQVKAINLIIACQISGMGSHRLTCECGHEKIVHNSCYNRHCPICGNFKKEMWIQKQEESMIPNHYFHLVFTLPDTLRPLAYYNKKAIYNLMYSAASKTLLEPSKDKLGTIPGFSLILHTWTQTLTFHPHLHCILVGGGLSLDQSHFKPFKKKFFLHVKVLSAVFKGKFMEGLKNLYSKGELYLPRDYASLDEQKDFQSYVDELYEKDWIVYSNILMHVLPHRFTKIRHYGFLSNRYRSSKVSLIRRLIARQRGVVLPIMKTLDKNELLMKLVGKERLCCSECGRYFTYNHSVCRN